MKIKYTHLVTAAVFAVTLCATSCSKDSITVPQETSSTLSDDLSSYTGEVLDVDYAVSIPEEADVEDMSDTIKSRSLKEDSQGKLHFDYDHMHNVTIHICLQKGNEKERRSYRTISATIEKRSDGSGYEVKIPENERVIQLNKGEYEGEGWKVCAILEETQKKGQLFTKGSHTNPKFDTNSYFYSGISSIKGTNKATTLSQCKVPLYSSFTPIEKVNGKIILPLKFQPIGAVVKMRITNTLAVPIILQKVKMHNPNIKAGQASVTLGEENSNGTLQFKFTGITSNTNQNSQVWSPSNTITWRTPPTMINGNSPTDLYVWCIPINGDKGGTEVEFVYEVESSRGYSDWDSIKIDPSKKDIALQSGHFYHKDLQTRESDLMFTEMLHLNPGGYNYTVIELYNPTNKTINLKDYGLIRMQTASLENGWSLINSKSFEQARVQSLFVSDFNQANYLGNGTWAPSAYQGGKNRYYNMFENWSDKSSQLAPGKCMIIGAGTLRANLARGREEHFYPTGSLMYNSFYLSNAVALGYCTYAVAVDNGSKEEAFSFDADATGVMQHGFNNIMVLVKRDKKNNEFEPIDFLMSACIPEMVQQFQNALPGVTERFSSEDYLFAVRKESVMYPISKRDPNTYFARNHSHLPDEEAILVASLNYQFYDWIFKFLNGQPRNWDYSIRQWMTPGTKQYNPRVDNEDRFLPGAHNERTASEPNPSTHR